MGHLDPKQVPSKSKPWVTFANQDFIHRVRDRHPFLMPIFLYYTDLYPSGRFNIPSRSI